MLKKYFHSSKDQKKLINIFVAFIASILWSMAKIIFGIVDNSAFLIASAIFTICLAISKLLCLVGIVKYETNYVIIHVISSLLIVGAGVFYGLYNTRLLYVNSMPNYGTIIAITIAAISFFLFVKAIVNLIKDKKRDDYNRNLRVIALVGGSMDIVLTQMCLLAVELPEMNPRYNLYIALGISIITMILGIYCLIKPFLKKNNISN